MENPELNRLLETLQSSFLPEKAKGVHATVQLHMNGASGGSYYLTIENQTLTSGRGEADDPVLTLTGRTEDLLAIFAGQLDPMTAFFSGKLEVDGDTSLGLRLMSMFKR